MDTTTQPVFIKERNIPDCEDNKPTVLEICRAAERAIGQGTIRGAQNIRGLWRIYPTTKEARNDLLIKRIIIRDTLVPVADKNPYILRADTDEEKPATKVWVDDIPISVADDEIEHAMIKTGCEMRSKIIQDRARDANNKLTRFLTGRRFVFISIPPVPLEKTMKVDIFTARIYHKEQKTARNVICSNCLEPNHHKSVCEKQVVCRACMKPGHKQGDTDCDITRSEKQRDERQQTTVPQPEEVADDRSRSKQKDGKQSASRSRPFTRQTTLRPTLELESPNSSRCRSETPKRRRSRDNRSPREKTEKQPRRDTGRDKRGERRSDSEEDDPNNV